MTKQDGISRPLRERLLRLDTCAVSDALDSLDLPGVATGLRSVTVSGRFAGPVKTVQLARAGSQTARRHLAVGAITRAQSGDVIVVSNGGAVDASCWGGLLSLAAARSGVAGAVLDGACRDVDDAQRLGFPVYARDVVSRTARGRFVEVATGSVISVAGVTVSEGDYVLADGSGVVFIARSELERALTVAEHIAEREAAMARAIESGGQLEEVLDGSYEDMLRERE